MDQKGAQVTGPGHQRQEEADRSHQQGPGRHRDQQGEEPGAVQRKETLHSSTCAGGVLHLKSNLPGVMALKTPCHVVSYFHLLRLRLRSFVVICTEYNEIPFGNISQE